MRLAKSLDHWLALVEIKYHLVERAYIEKLLPEIGESASPRPWRFVERRSRQDEKVVARLDKTVNIVTQGLRGWQIIVPPS